jgi:hypothetical protein
MSQELDDQIINEIEADEELESGKNNYFPKEPIYVMTLELEEGKNLSLNIYEDSDPEKLAILFCEENNLDLAAVDYLKSEIENLIQSFKVSNENKAEIIEETEEEAITDKYKNINNGNEIENEEANMTGGREDDSQERKESEEVFENIENKIINDFNQTIIPTNNKHDLVKDTHRENESENNMMTQVSPDDKTSNINVNNYSNNSGTYSHDLNERSISYKESKDHLNFTLKNPKLNAYSEKNLKFGNFRNIRNQSHNHGQGDSNNYEDSKTTNKVHEVSNELDLNSGLNLQSPNEVVNNIDNKESLKPHSANLKQNFSMNNLKKLSIHERLFQDAEIKRKLPKKIIARSYLKQFYPNISRIATKRETPSFRLGSQVSQNYGEYLYYRGKVLNENRARKIAQEKTQKEIIENSNCSFQPKISHINKDVLCSRKSNRIRDDKVVSSLQHKLQSEVTKTEFSSDSNSKPNINYIIDSEKSAQRKIEKLEKLRREINSQFTFKPEIQANYNTTYNSYYLERKKEKCNSLHYNIHKENLPTFQPKINKFNKVSKISKLALNQGTDVFQSNYEYANKYNQNRENLKSNYEQDYIIKNLPQRTFEKSENIYNKIKTDKYKRIFKLLDSDQDDYISIQNINLKSLPKEIRRIIDPIIVELKEENENLNEEEFVRAMEHLYHVFFLTYY